jgi:ABC-type transport system substrate-binding protein
MAMDPDDANNKADEGAATVSDNIFPEDSPYFDPAARIPFKGDLAQAQALIDSYVAEKGGPVTLTWLTAEGNTRRWVEAYAQQVNQKLKNVDFKVEVVTTAVALQSFYDDSFQVLGSSFIGVDPVLQMNQRLACGSGRNNANYCNPDVDAAFKQALRSPDRASRVDAIKKAQQVLWQDVPFFLQSRAINYTATSENLGGVDSFAEGLLTLDWAWLAKP